MNIGRLMLWSRKMLENAGMENASFEARMLFCFALRKEPIYVLTNKDYELSYEEEVLIRGLTKKRTERFPLQYIMGETCFMSLSFKVTADVLIPRKETEILVEEVLSYIGSEANKNVRVLDLCTGSGCIAVSLAYYNDKIILDASDICEKALKVAKTNASSNHVTDRIDFIKSNLFEKIGERYDVIVSNPPYIASEVISGLEDEVKKYEPLIALDGGEDGLLYYRKIITGSVDHLKKGGVLFLETGCDQADDVSSLMKTYFTDIRVIKDYSGNDRIVWGKINF